MIWLTGANGMLGSDIEIELKKNKIHYIASDYETDITDIDKIKDFIDTAFIGGGDSSGSGDSANWIINAAAYTDVDGAESDIEKAFLINAEAVKNLAEVSKSGMSAPQYKGGISTPGGSHSAGNINLIHISSDYVFSGDKNEPYVEDDLTSPQNVYGKSKLKGENYLRQICNNRGRTFRYFIIRTSWLYGKNGKNFVKTILKAGCPSPNIKAESPPPNEIRVVDDQYGCPTYTVDLAKVIIKIISENFKNWGRFTAGGRSAASGKLVANGIYHFTNDGAVSWYEFAKEIYRIGREIGLIKKEVKLIPVPASHYPTAAVRPKYSVLSKEKIKNQMGIKIRNYTDSLREFLLCL